MGRRRHQGHLHRHASRTTLSGKQDHDIRPPNDLRFGVGVDIPILPILHIIIELDRTILDGGDLPEPDYSMLTVGGRFCIGHTGWAVSGGVNANLDMLVHHGINPSPLGGIVGRHLRGLAAAPAAAGRRPAGRRSPRRRGAEARRGRSGPRRPRRRAGAALDDRRDLLRRHSSARLTNIAKAILDGIALRMKNDLNSTAVVTGYTDNSGAEKANLAISARSAPTPPRSTS